MKKHFAQEKTKYIWGPVRAGTVPLQAAAQDLSGRDVTFPLSCLVSDITSGVKAGVPMQAQMSPWEHNSQTANS